jgi:hypothetical protein
MSSDDCTLMGFFGAALCSHTLPRYIPIPSPPQAGIQNEHNYGVKTPLKTH